MLTVSRRYFNDAYECVLEIGVIIAQAMWRKLLPFDRQEADANLNFICYELITEKRYQLACTLLDHAAAEFKHHSSTEEYVLLLLINRAQAYRWKGDKKTAEKIIKSHDWSAKGNEYKLAAAVLLDDFPEVYRLMRIIGDTGKPNHREYKEWPLFTHIRTEAEFIAVYEEIFGKPFMDEANAPNEPSLFELLEGGGPIRKPKGLQLLAAESTDVSTGGESGAVG